MNIRLEYQSLQYQYRYLVFKYTLDKLLKKNQDMTLPSLDKGIDEILNKAEYKVKDRAKKTSRQIRYEYQYNVMKEALNEILLTNPNAETPTAQELDEIFRKVESELEQFIS
jgi:hypothetical protein